MSRRPLYLLALLLSSAHAANIDGSVDASYGEATGYTLVGITGTNPRPGGMAVSNFDSTWMFGADRSDGTRLLITRLITSTGFLNTSFGPASDGRRLVTLPTGYREPIVTGAAVQADGKPYVYGELDQGNGLGGFDGFLCRFTVAGTLDAGFSADGCVQFRSGIDNSEACTVEDVAFDASNRPVAVGHCRLLPSQDHHRFVARLSSAGVFDTAFAGGSNLKIVPIEANQSNNLQQTPAVAITPQGRIVTLSTVDTTANSFDIVLTRYEDDGDLDPTFGLGGLFVPALESEVSNHSEASDLQLLADGKLLILGEIGFSGDYMVLVQVLANGSALDASFASGGVQLDTVPHNLFDAQRLIVDDLGRAITIARGTDLQADACHFINRFNKQGGLDPTFGNGGRICLRAPTSLGTVPTLNAFNTIGVSYDRNGLVVAAHAQNNQDLSNYFISYRLAGGQLFRDGLE